MISNISNSSTGKANIKLVLGISLGVMITVVLAGTFFLSSHFSMRNKVATGKITPPKEVFYPIEAEPEATPEPQPDQPSVPEALPTQTPKIMAAARPAEPAVNETDPEETWQETDESYAEAAYESEQFEMRAKEIQHLKEALPNNFLIPYDRTPEEAEELLAYAQEVSQELNTIKESIDNNTATSEERQRYFDIISKQFDDEIELINYCNDMVADPNGDNPVNLCGQILESADQQIQAAEVAKERLRKEILQEK